jgi:hypothetical protein
MANQMQLKQTLLLGTVLALTGLSGCKPQAKSPAVSALPAAPTIAQQPNNTLNLNPLPVPPQTSNSLPTVSLNPLPDEQPRLSKPMTPSKRDPFGALIPQSLPPSLQSRAPKQILSVIAPKAKSVTPQKKALKSASKPPTALKRPTFKAPSVEPTLPIMPIAPPAIAFIPAPTLPMAPPMPSVVPAIAAPIALVNQVEITGIAQVGGRLLVVAKGPGESSARTLAPGSYISNGQILIKEVRQNGKDPVVVLVENGVETLLTVTGSRAMSVAAQ